MDESLQERVFDAAMAELLIVGLDDFSLERVAGRVGVDPHVLTAHWPDRRLLLMDTMTRRAATATPVPDTGSLRGDMQAVADSLAALSATPEARKWFHRVLPHGRDADLYEVGHDFWEIRFATMVPILHRAAERGELQDDLDLDHVIRIFAAACSFDMTFNDAPLRPEFLALVIDVIARGITR